MLRIALILMALLAASKAFSQTQMQFAAFAPDRPTNAAMGVHAWRIYASGPIDEDADKRLEEVIQNNKIPHGSDIYLHSGGGSLVGGMKLGNVPRRTRAARKPGIATAPAQWPIWAANTVS